MLEVAPTWSDDRQASRHGCRSSEPGSVPGATCPSAWSWSCGMRRPRRALNRGLREAGPARGRCLGLDRDTRRARPRRTGGRRVGRGRRWRRRPHRASLGPTRRRRAGRAGNATSTDASRQPRKRSSWHSTTPRTSRLVAAAVLSGRRGSADHAARTLLRLLGLDRGPSTMQTRLEAHLGNLRVPPSSPFQVRLDAAFAPFTIPAPPPDPITAATIEDQLMTNDSSSQITRATQALSARGRKAGGAVLDRVGTRAAAALHDDLLAARAEVEALRTELAHTRSGARGRDRAPARRGRRSLTEAADRCRAPSGSARLSTQVVEAFGAGREVDRQGEDVVGALVLAAPVGEPTGVG